jgi:hypothetical protein
MDELDQETSFDRIIDARLASDDWNLLIARSLLKKKRKKRNIFIASGLAISLAAGAFISSMLMPVSQNVIAEGEELNNFIQAQVDGTWRKNSVSIVRIGKNDISLVGAQYDASLDEIIEETLSERF